MPALNELTATEALGLLERREATSVELVTACLERIGEREHLVRAWAHLEPEQALGRARELDAQREPRGILHGLPVGVKDVIDTADMPTAYGSAVFAGRRPERDAECVRRLQAAGAVILGKTATTELALYHPAETANPHDLGRTPGGSSSGSAAAVADRMVPLALGTQTAGSVIRPASFCGVFGLKPTYGRLSTEGVLTLSRSLDTVGLFARSPGDLRLGAAALGIEPDPGLRPCTHIGFVRTRLWGELDEGSRRSIEAGVAGLTDADVDELELPELDGLIEAQITIMEAEIAESLGPLAKGLAVSPGLADLLARGANIPRRAYDEALQLARSRREQISAVLGTVDLLLTPAVRGEAPRGLDSTGDPLFCRTWTLLGTPAVAVPGLVGRHGVPLGVQVVAPQGGDAAALAGAEWLAARL